MNDAPVNTVPGAQSVAEDTALPIAGVSVADVDSGTLTTTLTVSSGTINVTAGAGVSGNGTDSVNHPRHGADINAALAGLSYTGNPDFNGADTLTIATTDGAAATDTDTIAITVNAVNDAPVNTVPGAQSVAEDTILPIAGVSVADVDGSTLTTTLNVSSGTINVNAVPGVSGNGTASVSITGTAAQINAALLGLSYTGNLNFNGADTPLTVARPVTGDRHRHRPRSRSPSMRERRPGQYRAGRAERRRGHRPADRRRLRGRRRQRRTLHHARRVARHAHRDRRPRRQRQRHRQRHHHRHGGADQRGAGWPLLTGNLNFNGADTLTIATTDGAAATDTDTIAITVNTVNDAPALNLDADLSTIGGVDYLTSFTDGGGAVPIADTDVLITDDNTQLVSATATLTNPDTLDVLAFTELPPGGIIATYDPGTHVLRSRAPRRLPTIGRRCTRSRSTTPVPRRRPIPASSTWSSMMERPQATGASDHPGHRSQQQCTHPRSRGRQSALPGNAGTSFRATFTENGEARSRLRTPTPRITDVDSTDLASATITLTDPQAGDLLAVDPACCRQASRLPPARAPGS